MIVSLTSQSGEVQQYQFDEDHHIIVIGRSQKCDISISSEHISRQHLEIIRRDADIYIKDLTLSNWVLYNDEKLPKNQEILYYDFASLILPGGFSVRITEEVEEKTGHLNRTITGTNSTIKATGDAKPFIKTMSGIHNKKSFPYKDSIPKDEQTGPTKSSILMTGRMRELSKFILIFLAVLLFIFIYLNNESNNKNEEDVQLNLRKKVVPSEQNNVKQAENSLPKRRQKVSKKSQENMVSFNEKLRALPAYCNEKVEIFCRLFLKERRELENVVLENNQLIIYKNYSHRVNIFFNAQTNKIETALREKKFEKVIVGENLLIPQLLEKLEKKGVVKVRVIFFENKNNKAIKKSSYRLDPSFYRRFELKNYKQAYQAIKKDLDLSLFLRELASLITEE
jgi:hypothetical protein